MDAELLSENRQEEKEKSIQVSELKEKSDLSRESISLKRNYILCKSSLAQIVETINQIKIIPKNDYELVLKENFERIIPEFIKSFDKLLKTDNENDYIVRKYNLICNLPPGVSIYPKEQYQKLRTANIGNLLYALYQRIDYIIERDIPDRYKDNDNEKLADSFIKLQNDLKLFRNDIRDFEDKFLAAIDNAHKSKKKSLSNSKDKSKDRSFDKSKDKPKLINNQNNKPRFNNKNNIITNK